MHPSPAPHRINVPFVHFSVPIGLFILKMDEAKLRGKGRREGRRERPVNGLTQAVIAALRVKHIVQAAVGGWGWITFQS